MAFFINIGIRFSQSQWKTVKGSIHHETCHGPFADHKGNDKDLEVKARYLPIQGQSGDSQHGLQIQWTYNYYAKERERQRCELSYTSTKPQNKPGIFEQSTEHT